jgi:uncharacterized protein YjbJ (UPF0337 family)
MTEDMVRGGFDQAKGTVKEAAGNLTGDERMQGEGNVDHAKGKVERGLGDVKDAAGSLKDQVGDAIDDVRR